MTTYTTSYKPNEIWKSKILQYSLMLKFKSTAYNQKLIYCHQKWYELKETCNLQIYMMSKVENKNLIQILVKFGTTKFNYKTEIIKGTLLDLDMLLILNFNQSSYSKITYRATLQILYMSQFLDPIPAKLFPSLLIGCKAIKSYQIFCNGKYNQYQC